MNSTETLLQLLRLLREDGMRLIWCTVPVREVVYVKGVLEAYPGVAAVHAPPGRVVGERAPFAVATTAGMAPMLEALLDDMAVDAGLLREPPPPAFAELSAGVVEASNNNNGIEAGLKPPPVSRMTGAWRAWLTLLATNADAATGAAHVYAEMSAEGRDAWLDALAEDVPQLAVPAIAAYGPLFSVEANPKRLARMRRAVVHPPAPAGCIRRALQGSSADGSHVAVLVMPLYLDFVRVLCFRFRVAEGFEWARQHAFALDDDAPRVGDEVEGIKLNRSCAAAVIDELAHAVLAHDRNGGEPPPLLKRCAELFSARVHDETAADPAQW